MANVIRLKRASGSDPAASDLVSGEPAVRTDTGELFFKKDDGSIAKVAGAGGGPDFKYLALRNAANNGAASFPNADFTLVTSGTTSAIVPTAANTLLVSVNGVIQKPNTGTSTPSSGFALSGSTIKFGANISAAPDFILYQESGGIGEPSDDTVSEVKLKVSNSPVNGYFLSAQSGNTGGLTWAAPVATSCTGNSATATALATARAINGVNFDGTSAITVTAAAGTLSGNTLNSSVVTSSLTSLGDLASLTVTGDLVVDTSTLKVDSSNNRVGIGTTSPVAPFHVAHSGTSTAVGTNFISLRSGASGRDIGIQFADGATSAYVGMLGGAIYFADSGSSETARFDSSGRLLLGTTTEGYTSADDLTVATTGHTGITIRSGNTSLGTLAFSDGTSGTAEFDGYIQYDQNNRHMDFATAGGNIRQRIDSSGNVGIGNTNPSSFHSSGNNLVVGSGSGEEGMTIYSGNTSPGVINFADSTSGSDSYEGRILYDHNTNHMRFHVNNGAERFRIDSDGRLLYGLTSSTRETSLILQGNSNSYTTNPGVLELRVGQVPSAQAALGSLVFGCTGDKIGGSISAIADNADWSSGSSHPTAIRFFTTPASSTTNTERMRIDSSGRVLIGTTTEGNGDADEFTIANVGGGNMGMTIRSATGALGNIFFSDGTSGDAEYRGMIQYGHNNDSMRFSTSATERMRIDSSGNLLIGTTAWVDNHFDNGIYLAGSTQAGMKFMRTASGSAGTYDIGIDTDNAFKFVYTGDSGGTGTERMRFLPDGDCFLGSASVAATHGSSNSSRGLVYDSDGGVGNHPFISMQHGSRSSGNPAHIKFQTAGNEEGSIRQSNLGFEISYNNTSDYRLKENVVDISDGITRLKTLKPRRYNWIADETNTTTDGFLAHEVMTAVPQAVTGTKDEVDENNKPVYQQIDQSKIVPLLVAALQEAIGRIEALEAK